MAPPPLRTSAREAGPRAASRPGRTLARDPWLWLNALVLAGSAAVYLVPGLDREVVAAWSESWLYVPALLAAIAGVLAGLRSVRDPRERRFWGLLAVAFGFFLAVRLLYLDPAPLAGAGELAIDGLYALFYLSILVALHHRPDRAPAAGDAALRRVESAATTVFVAALFAYFVGVPEVVAGDLYETWVPSLLLYVTLDAFVLLTLVHLLRTSPSREWRVAFGLLTGAAVLWSVTDLFETTVYLGRATWLATDSPLNTLWIAPFTAVAVAARVGRARRRGSSGSWRAGEDRDPAPYRHLGSTLAYALVLPGIHLLVSLTGALGEETRVARDVVALVALLLLLGLAMLHQRLLGGVTRRLRELGRRLESQRRLLAGAIEQAEDAILVADVHGRLVYANAAWYRAVGPAADDESVPATLESLASEAEEAWAVATTEGRASCNVSRRAADGSTREEILSLSSVTEPDGAVSHLMLILRDVTRQAALERQLRRVRRMESLGTMAGGIAHDFNNVLTGILGYADLMRDEIGPVDPAREDLEGIVQAALRARALTGQILAFSRQEIGRAELVDPGEVVSEAVQLMGPSIPDGVTVEIERDDLGGGVWVEPARLDQVAASLLRNALQAVGERGRIRISVRAEVPDPDDLPSGAIGSLAPGRYAVLAVSDDGVGMSPETIERMYDPFFTTRGIGHGAGLGLSAVHSVVAALGGEIIAESQPGAGTSIRVYLPLRPSGQSREEGDVEPSRPGRLRVLLVCSDEEVAGAVRDALDGTSWELTRGADPEGGLERFLRAPAAYDVMVVDERLPGLGGSDLAGRIHRMRPRLPIVLLSSGTPSREELEGAGIARLVAKPVREKPLREALAAVGASPGRLLDRPGP